MAQCDAPDDLTEGQRLFAAESAYAASMFQLALGDVGGSIEAAERALECKPDYAPALLTVASIEYQRGNEQRGARLLRSLRSLPDEGGDLWEAIDKAGDFLIQEHRYDEGLEHYTAACRRFSGRTSLLQGLACCAGHMGQFDVAVDASREALSLEPGRCDLTSDLGWSLFEAGRLEEAEETLLRAVELDPDDDLARENLRHCRATRSGERTLGAVYPPDDDPLEWAAVE